MVDSSLTKPAVSVATPATKPQTIEERIEAWFVRHMHNSPVSQQTPIMNYVRQAVNELKIDLKDFIAKL